MSLSPFYRDTWAQIDLDNIYNNVKNMNEYLGEDVAIIAVVKANAYGHGAVQVAKTAIEAGAAMLAVGLIDEGIKLRKAGIDVPILVLGWVRPEYVQIALEYNFTLTAFQLDWFKNAATYLNENCRIDIHLKLDTGMGRIGVRETQALKEILSYIDKHSEFNLKGLFTHFATADECEDSTYFDFQYEKLESLLNAIPENKKEKLIIHCANSAAGLRFPKKVHNAVRLGISMYGLSPSIEMKSVLPFPLEEAFSLHSRLVHVKKIEPGEKVSYGGTYVAQEEEWIGTVPIGYADGYIRKLRDSDVLVNGQRCSIVGRICMDQLMIRLNEEVPIGTEVTLIGKQVNECISVDEVANYLETINYEVPCIITSRVPRMFLRKKRIIEVEH